MYPSSAGYEFISLDITNRSDVFARLESFNADVIIHTAAMTQVDPCELNQDLANRVNVEGTRNMADLATKCGAKFVYVSTDFVFDGLSGPYSESDLPNPVSHYGMTKFEGEKITKGLSVPWAIVRTILVYGVTPAMSRSNLVLWVKKALEEKKPIRVVTDHFRMPTLVDDLAWGIVEIVKRDARGIYHLSGNELNSVYDLAVQTAKFFKLDESLISPIQSDVLNEPGKRPPKTGFLLRKSQKDLSYQPKSFEEGLGVVQNLLISQQ